MTWMRVLRSWRPATRVPARPIYLHLTLRMEASLTCRYTLNSLVRWASKTVNIARLSGPVHVNVTISELERELRLQVFGFTYHCVHQTNVFIILQNIVYNCKLRKNDVVIVDYVISLHMREE